MTIVPPRRWPHCDLLAVSNSPHRTLVISVSFLDGRPRLRRPSRSLEESPRSGAQSLHLVELLVLVLDVDRHVRVDLLERLEELAPPVDVVAAADGDEVPG